MKLFSKLAVGAASTVLCFCVTEIVVRAADLFKSARATTREPTLEEHNVSAETDKVFVQHPYLGYSGNPSYRDKPFDEAMGVAVHLLFPGEPTEYYLRNSKVNAQGFVSEHEDYLRGDGAFNIGVFGGSVAHQLSTVGGDTLIAEVETRFPELRGRVRVLNFATGGYKQPQQLINLMLTSVQGVRLHVVINLDGFNEVAMSGYDVTTRYNPVLPSRFHYLTLMMKLGSDTTSSDTIVRYAEVLRLRRKADRWHSTANRWPWDKTELGRALLGKLAVRSLDQANRKEIALHKSIHVPVGVLDYQPPCLEDEVDPCWDVIADIWEQSSLQMDAIARQIGAQYLHFVQPNQYVEGSKALTDRERELAYTPEIPWAQNTRKGYPLLKERIPAMIARGVDVHELTSVFAEITEDIYIDACCHYNKLGNDLVAATIAEHVQWDGRSPEAR
jgi:hypothetical protein